MTVRTYSVMIWMDWRFAEKICKVSTTLSPIQIAMCFATQSSSCGRSFVSSSLLAGSSRSKVRNCRNKGSLICQVVRIPIFTIWTATNTVYNSEGLILCKKVSLWSSQWFAHSKYIIDLIIESENYMHINHHHLFTFPEAFAFVFIRCTIHIFANMPP